VDDGDGSGSYGAADDQQAFDSASSFVRHRLVSAARTFSVLVMFYGWTPFVVFVDGGRSFSGWWVALLALWLTCTAFFGVVTVIEKRAS
jgi:hypothetical protein